MTALLLIVGAVVGFAAGVAVLALVGAVRGKKTPPAPLYDHATDWPTWAEELSATEPFDHDGEQVIRQALWQHQVDQLAKRRHGSPR